MTILYFFYTTSSDNVNTNNISPVPPGFLERKQEAGRGGKRATVRSWRAYYSVLCGQLLCFFRDELDFASAKAAAPPVAILNVSGFVNVELLSGQ